MGKAETGVTLVIGGARSGKSRHAQALAEAHDGELVFIATGQAFDGEMADRIARHRADRGPRWHTVEAPIALPDAIAEAARPDTAILVDCLTLWASNLMLANEDVAAHVDRLEQALAGAAGAAGAVLLVSNEVGWGIVPDNALARRFRDVAGTINQRIAARADRVVLVAAGLPLTLKPA